ncbi:MAG: peptide deformylase, partial [Bacteroidota bacterium]|nr:peptide deformylase [Bacteroidota bacterium]
MILPIVAYGDPVLKKKATEISSDYPNLKTLIANMYETMYGAHGVGLAAPQVGLSIRLFLVDTAPFSEDESLSVSEAKALKGFKKTFINPEIIEQTGEEW